MAGTFIPYVSIAQVDDFAKGIQEKRWQDLDNNYKEFIIFYATIDLELYHEQPRQSFNVPWKLGDVWMMEACKYQSLFVMRTKSAREWQERATIMTESSINDSIINVGAINKERPELDPEAERLLKQQFGEMIGAARQFFWGRG